MQNGQNQADTPLPYAAGVRAPDVWWQSGQCLPPPNSSTPAPRLGVNRTWNVSAPMNATDSEPVNVRVDVPNREPNGLYGGAPSNPANETSFAWQMFASTQAEMAMLRQQILQLQLSSPAPSKTEVVEAPSVMLPSFDPDNVSGLTATHWLRRIDEIAVAHDWSDAVRMARVLNKLEGTARVWYDTVATEVVTWESFKSALIRAFPVFNDVASIHAQLAARKKSAKESYAAYAYEMSSIARRGNLEEGDVVGYVLRGIDAATSLALAALPLNSIEQLLAAISRFHARRVAVPRSDAKATPPKAVSPEQQRKRLTCSNCGTPDHAARDCRKGPRCYNCNKFGHRKAECKAVRSTTTSRVNYIKAVKVNGRPCTALWDTGSNRNLVSSEVTQEVKPTLREETNVLQGFAGAPMRCDVAEINIEVDGHRYDESAIVVPPETINVDLLLGREFLDKIDYNSKHGTIRIVDAEQQPTTESLEISSPINNHDTNLLVSEMESIMKIDLIEEDELVNPLRNSNAVTGLLPEQISRLENIVSRYAPVATEKTTTVTTIELQDSIPVAQQPRRLAPAELEAVDKQVKQWLKEGIIRHSSSPYSSPVVLVKKKDGTLRMCIDYRRLNAKVVRDRYPLPQLDDQLDKLQRARVFSTIDLRNGFLHVPVEESSRKYTAFVTPAGQYEFNRTPFGFVNSSASFVRFVNEIFKPLIDEGILATYLDDVVIMASDEEEAMQRLERVLDRAASFALQINWKKCQFLQRKILFLGYEIEGGKMQPNPEKIRAVEEFPTPSNCKELQRFLGLAGYFRRFINNYANIAKPLTNLLKKDALYDFGPEQVLAFNSLKRKLCQKPILQIYNPSAKITQLHTDASRTGIAAILMQSNDSDKLLHPVHYFSKTTSPAQRNYSSYELEVLAIVEALRKYRVYLLGLSFTIVTDCAAFQQSMAKRDLSTRIARWALRLEDFAYHIEHRAGTAMRHVDALSRVNVAAIEDTLLFQIKQALQQDVQAQSIRNNLEKGRNEGFRYKNGLLCRIKGDRDLLYVPKKLLNDLLRRTHEMGHFASRKTIEAFKKEYWAPALNAKVQAVIESCVPCILGNEKRGKQEGFLQPIDKSGGPLHTLHLDHLGPLSTTDKGYQHLSAVIDSFTKFLWLFPVKTTTAQETIRKLRTVRATFGNPFRMITDRGAAFTSNAFQRYCEEEDIRQVLVTTGVPRGNGQVERIHQVVKSMITKLSLGATDRWYRHVETVQRLINSSFQRSIGNTPFELLTGVAMRNPEEIELRRQVEDALIQVFRDDRDDLRLRARQHILEVQQQNRRQYNRRRKAARRYEVDDLVAIRRTQFTTTGKFKTPFLGPYRIVARLGRERYAVERIGDSEGPRKSTASADHLKPWVPSHETDDYQCATSTETTTDPHVTTVQQVSKSVTPELEDCRRVEGTRYLSGTAELWARIPYSPPRTRRGNGHAREEAEEREQWEKKVDET